MFNANELAPSFLLAVSLFLLAGIGLACCTTPTATVDGLKEEIDKECPIGSHYPKVMQFLDSKGIRHSPYKEDKEYDLSIGDYRISKKNWRADTSGRAKAVHYMDYLYFL